MVCRLGKFPQLTRTVFTSADGLASDNITALCYGADNCLYVGTDRGLSKIDGKKITTVDIGIENAPISMLFCANDGHIFVGTGKSIIELSGKKIIASREFSSDAVAMKQDCDNVTWILTKTVLYRCPARAAASPFSATTKSMSEPRATVSMRSSARDGTGRSSWRA